MVKQYCTVLHKRALINNLGGRVATQLQMGNELYGISDGGKRKVGLKQQLYDKFFLTPSCAQADEPDSKYARMVTDWHQIDFSFYFFDLCV